jgi:hypothetical protein
VGMAVRVIRRFDRKSVAAGNLNNVAYLGRWCNATCHW